MCDQYTSYHSLTIINQSQAFSAHQGWTEGALQTAEECAAIVLASKNKSEAELSEAVSPYSRPLAVDGADKMSYMGLVVDVSQWANRHPGGAGPIKGFGGKDVTEMFENLHGGWPAALATLFGLQSGVVVESKKKD
jgi:cytochrome b involved in lipid metabolism